MQDLSLLIKKSLDGSATEAELKTLLTLLSEQESSLYDDWMQKKDQSADRSVTMYPAFDQQAIKALISSRIRQMEPAPAPRLSPYRRLLKYRRPVAAAVAVVGLLIAALFVFNQRPQQLAKQELSYPMNTLPTIIEAGNEQRTIVLKDSSVVLLYAGSSLQYDHSYNIHSRKLLLKGKGLFTVKKQKDKPFTVYSKHLSTTALGTVFEVRENQDSTVVSLLEGKVKVQDLATTTPRTVYLLAGQQATGYPNAEIAVQRIAREPLVVQQRAGKSEKATTHDQPLSFRQQPLENVFEILQKQYRTNIRFDKQALSGILFTGSFESGESVEAILQVIGSINKLEIHSGPQGFIIKK